MPNFTLQLLHHADFEGNTNAIGDAPELAALFDYFDDFYTANTLKLSGGDNWIPSPWYSSQTGELNAQVQAVYETLLGLDEGALSGLTVSEGTIDQAILNVIGIQASTLGNHEFDQGPDDIARIIEFAADKGGDDNYDLSDISNLGSFFPYLTTNLDFSANADLGDSYSDALADIAAYGVQADKLASAGGIEALLPDNGADLIAPYATAVVNGETIGIVGATTQRLAAISSPGDVAVSGASDDDMDLLASQVQARVDQLTAAGVNKVILISHLQNYQNEAALAPKLSGVDIILSAGSDAIFADQTDTLKEGDVANVPSYPLIHTGADGNPIVQVNTDGQYHYLGRLVVDFNENGVVQTDSIDAAESGAYATTDAVVQGLYGNNDPYAQGTKAGLVKQLADAVDSVIGAKIANVAGYSDVYLDGQRSTVRNEESNLGNLTADANRYFAEQYLTDNPSAGAAAAPLVSLKNGGGIRSDIGLSFGVAGPEAPVDGKVTQLDIETALAFNNGLVLYSTTAEGLKNLLEHGIDQAGETSGRFPQVSGLSFSYDKNQTSGSKLESLALTDADGNILEVLIAEGQFMVARDKAINVVTLNFLAEKDGDGYPFAANQVGDLVYMYDQESSGFEAEGREQQAFYDYMQAQHGSADKAFKAAETGLSNDTRIQSLADRGDGIEAKTAGLSLLGTYETGIFDQSAAEIAAYDAQSGLLFSVNSVDAKVNVISLEKLITPGSDNASMLLSQVDLSGFGGGINSVAVSHGVLAVAVEAETKTDAGSVVIFDIASVIANGINDANRKVVTVGALPDMVTFTPDGKKILVANEGEPNDDYSVDPEGSVSIIDLPAGVSGVSDASVTTLGFTDFNSQQAALAADGVRIFGPNATVAQDLEPEYIAVSPDGLQAVVTLQENNAIATLDLSGTPRIESVTGLGLKDHSQADNALDASDKDGGINITTEPVFGMYQPDAVAAFEINSSAYYIYANEGDSRDYDTFSEESRIRDLTLDPIAFPNAATLQADDQLGRLQVTTQAGADTDGDGDIDQLLAYGSRSVSIRDGDGNLVWDSGSLIEVITAQIHPDNFNASNDEHDAEGRSDNKGPEPEAVTVGVIGDQTYAFVGLERVSGIMTFNVTDPAKPFLVDYINNRDFSADVTTAAAGDLGPEGLTFISAGDSPTGLPVLVVSNEVSGTISAYNVEFASNKLDTQSGLLSLPEVLVDGVLHQANLRQIESGVFQLDKESFYTIDDQPGIANAIYADETLKIDRVEVGDQAYSAELKLIGGSDIALELVSATLL